MFGSEAYASVPYAASGGFGAMDQRGLLRLSQQAVYSVEIASSLLPAGRVTISDSASKP